MELSEQKRLLRGRMKEKLSLLNPEQIALQSEGACRRLAMLPQFSAAELILAYMPLPGECDTGFVIALARAMDKRVAFPRCEGEGELALYIPKSFIKGAYGILEPDVAFSTRIAPEEVDFVVVPGLAFDSACGRLGRGKGYYDRLLKKTEAFRAGLALDVQLVPEVPMAEQDVYMDAVAANNWIYCK